MEDADTMKISFSGRRFSYRQRWWTKRK